MTGHHCNDHAETILMNLSRQTGILGMSGIQQKNGKIIRPLLSFNKKSCLILLKDWEFNLLMILLILILHFPETLFAEK